MDARQGEEAIDADLPLCDPHHHLWQMPGDEYMFDDLFADIAQGHRVVRTVHVEAGAKAAPHYRTTGPEHLRPVGETEFVVAAAAESRRRGGAVIEGIVGFADLMLGEGVRDAVAAHVDAGAGLFRGIRHPVTWDADQRVRSNRAAPGLLREPRFLEGLEVLAEAGVSFDAWLFHPQLNELTAVARAIPDLIIVVDHFGGPLGVGPYRDRAETRAAWRDHMAQLATCRNVYVKLGGIGVDALGSGAWLDQPPLTSRQLAGAWGMEAAFCIDTFGYDRCMFESNFPVDRLHYPYVVVWNAFKRMTRDCTAEQKRWLFHDTAATAYRLTTMAADQRVDPHEYLV